MSPETNERAGRWYASAWTGYAFVLVTEAGLTAGLLILEPYFPLGKAATPYVLLTMLIASLFGVGPAIASIVVGWLVFTYYFVPSEGILWPPASTQEAWVRQVAFFLGSVLVSIAIIQARRSHKRIAERTAQLEEQVTERERIEEAETRLAAIVESSDDAIVGKDLNGIITSWNQGAEHMYGYAADEVLGKHLSIIIPPEHSEELPRILEAVQRGERVHNYETERLTKDGRRLQMSITASPILDRSGRVVGASTIGRDITDRKQAEEEIRRLNAELEERVAQRTAALQKAVRDLENSNAELEAFSYSVSHDLRAPLRAIDGFSNTVLKYYGDKLDDRGKDYLRRMRAAAIRMGQLIDDILGLSRATRAEMHFQEVDLSTMAAQIVAELRSSQPNRKAEVVISPEMKVSGDPDLLRIAMDNLIGNAWKFTGNRETARIEIGCSEQDGERVYFVKDNGAGFDPAYVDKLFSPFQRLHSVNEFPGTGVGLALVRRILRRHGGRIWAEAQVDRGATFFFTVGETRK